MFAKKIISLIICFVMVLSISACNNVDENSSTNSSDNSSSPASTVTSTEQNTSKQPDSSSNNSSSKPDNSSNDSSDNSSNTSSQDYGLSRITNITYKCLKDLPGGDAQYQLDTVSTDTGTALDYMFDLSCKDKSIKIDKLVVTIPFEYRQKHDSVTVTATHRFAKISGEFVIKFDKWNLVFEDDFNGTTLNTNVWNVWDEKRDSGYAYSKQNSFLDGKGNLVNRMSVLKEPDPITGQTKLTSVIETNDKFETTYGYFEIRMIPHRAMGLMGAFWLNCGDMSNENAPKDNTAVNGCEIDIVETFYHTKTPAQTIHWDGYGWYQDENGEWQTVTKTKGLYVPPMENIFDGNYHTFSLYWSPEEYIFFVDGEVTNRTDVMGICNQPGYILISSHFNTDAGELPLKPGEHTDMIVDYVRVYKTDALK